MTMIGIDPHKTTHTAVAIDDNEQVLDEYKIRASTVQAVRLRDWADRFEKREWAIESANGLGYLLAQQLVAVGETVFDVPPLLASLVRGGSLRLQRPHEYAALRGEIYFASSIGVGMCPCVAFEGSDNRDGR